MRDGVSGKLSYDLYSYRSTVQQSSSCNIVCTVIVAGHILHVYQHITEQWFHSMHFNMCSLSLSLFACVF